MFALQIYSSFKVYKISQKVLNLLLALKLAMSEYLVLGIEIRDESSLQSLIFFVKVLRLVSPPSSSSDTSPSSCSSGSFLLYKQELEYNMLVTL